MPTEVKKLYVNKMKDFSYTFDTVDSKTLSRDWKTSAFGRRVISDTVPLVIEKEEVGEPFNKEVLESLSVLSEEFKQFKETAAAKDIEHARMSRLLDGFLVESFFLLTRLIFDARPPASSGALDDMDLTRDQILRTYTIATALGGEAAHEKLLSALIRDVHSAREKLQLLLDRVVGLEHITRAIQNWAEKSTRIKLLTDTTNTLLNYYERQPPSPDAEGFFRDKNESPTQSQKKTSKRQDFRKEEKEKSSSGGIEDVNWYEDSMTQDHRDRGFTADNETAKLISMNF
ncbi:MAG: hypothetical protein MMC33_007810 [Icmadophila ericetorum]|nr:hypothetical protein [Icmadophila ericetorum]